MHHLSVLVLWLLNSSGVLHNGGRGNLLRFTITAPLSDLCL